MSKSPITTHILDTAVGRPAAGVRVVLDRQDAEAFVCIGEGVTDADGRISDLLEDGALQAGVHRLTFHVGDYLSDAGRAGFYPQIPVVFEITVPDEHHHVPLLLNPFGYSTYRGS
jgi:5-hydroxyisourate hydrolase